MKKLRIICLVEDGNKNIIPSIFQKELTINSSFIDSNFDPEIQFIDIADISKLRDMDLEDVIIDTTFGKMLDIVHMVNTVRSSNANIIDVLKFNCRMSRMWFIYNVTKVFLCDTRSDQEWKDWESMKIKLRDDLYLNGFSQNVNHYTI